MTALPTIATRNQLLGMLAEAAELEHDLMCLYLYAVFSLKTDVSEELSESELKLVISWRETMMSVCIQEMSHLALVSNLSTAVGGNAHMFRSNFPIRSGYFPSDFVMELAPFDQGTLDHFIFLERSADSEIEDSDEAQHEEYTRDAPDQSLMTHGGDYSTVGDLYECIRQGILHLAETLGEQTLFCGDTKLQLTTEDLSMDGMDTIRDVPTALKAIERIVEEGEGGKGGEKSHFQKFTEIRKQYRAALLKNPDFKPARPSARNPVMRKPTEDTDVTWINHPLAAPVLDAVNAVYDLMVRCLTLLYSGEARPKPARDAILGLTFDLMKCLGIAAGYLSSLEANEEKPGFNAGVTFATNRHFLPPLVRNERLLIAERLEEMIASLEVFPSQLQEVLRSKLEPHHSLFKAKA